MMAKLAKLRERGIEVDEENFGQLEKVDEEALSEFNQGGKRKKRKKKKGDFTAWDENDAKNSKRKRKYHYEEVKDKDGNVIKIRKVKKPKVTSDLKTEKNKGGHLPKIKSPDRLRNAQGNQFPESDLLENMDDEARMNRKGFDARNSNQFNLKPGQIMGLGDHLMMQYNQLTQR